MKIIRARITMGPMPTVFATTEDGVEHRLFDYYPDEIRFDAEEFIGLTIAQAHHLHYERDRAYLRS